MEDPQECESGVVTYWGKIAMIIFSEQGATETCHAMNDKCNAKQG